jgi:Putative zincin peptidase
MSKNIAISQKEMNLYFLVACVLTYPFLEWYSRYHYQLSFLELKFHFKGLHLLMITAAGMVLHELIHAATYKLLQSKKPAKVSFGLAYSILYARMHEEMTLRTYRLVLLSPFVLLGCVPLIYSLVTVNDFYFVCSILMILASVGDLLILFNIRTFDKRAMVRDGDNWIGCTIIKV